MTPWSARRVILLAFAILAAYAWSTCAAAPASAHAVVVATSPSNGSEISTSPHDVRITFDEPVSRSATSGTASVLDSSGRAVTSGQPKLLDGGRTLSIPLRPNLSKDSYIASWTVVSADNHPVGGSIQFGVGVPAIALAPPPAPTPSALAGLLSGVLTGLLYIALIGALGLIPAALLLDASPPPLRTTWRLARIAAAVAVILSLVQIVVAYIWDASATPSGPTWDGFADFGASSYALLVYLRIAVIVAAVLVVGRAPGQTPRWDSSEITRLSVAGVCGLAALATVVANGHGGSGPIRFVSTFIHVVAMVGWIGGLLVLTWLLVHDDPSSQRLRRLGVWSVVAASCVAAIVATGVVAAVIGVGHFAALVHTSYGVTLLVKLAMVALAIALGASSHRRIRRSAREHVSGPAVAARIRTRVGVEAVVGCAIIVVAGVLSSLTPAAAAYAPTRTIETTVGEYALRIDVGPARRGPETFRVVVTPTAPQTGVAAPTSISLVLRQPDSGVRGLPVDFSYRLPGDINHGRPAPVTFISPAVTVPTTGEWIGTLTLNPVTGDSIAHVKDFTYRVV